jgi:drug/metabolite transporter (DMT)-like permease
MLAISLALIACLSWGTSGFLAGIKSKIMPVLVLLFFSSMAGLAMFAIGVGVRGAPLPRDPNLLFAVLGGLVGVGGLYCFYRGLATGAISIVVPISALCVLLPVAASLLRGEIFQPIQGLGMATAVGGGVLISLENNSGAEKKRLAAGIFPAFGAALGFGAFYVVMDLAGSVDPLWAATLSRTSFFLFLLPALLYKRPSLKIVFNHLPAVCIIGMLDGIAAFAYTSATTKGLLSLVSVVSSLYPAVSVILALLFLKERLRRFQLIGVVLAIIGIALISAG